MGEDVDPLALGGQRRAAGALRSRSASPSRRSRARRSRPSRPRSPHPRANCAGTGRGTGSSPRRCRSPCRRRRRAARAAISPRARARLPRLALAAGDAGEQHAGAGIDAAPAQVALQPGERAVVALDHGELGLGLDRVGVAQHRQRHAGLRQGAHRGEAGVPVRKEDRVEALVRGARPDAQRHLGQEAEPAFAAEHRLAQVGPGARRRQAADRELAARRRQPAARGTAARSGRSAAIAGRTIGSRPSRPRSRARTTAGSGRASCRAPPAPPRSPGPAHRRRSARSGPGHRSPAAPPAARARC